MHSQTLSFEFLGKHIQASESRPWDCVLLESRSFVAIPTVGALVEGWLLIVPRQRCICFGALEHRLMPELREFKARVAATIERSYGTVAAFEHGPASMSQAVGCGVDYAHLHVLPAPCDLVEAASEAFEERLSWREVASLEATRELFCQGLPYLYVEQPIGRARITTHPRFSSQLIRKGVAQRLGVPRQYNWREYPMLENVRRTIARLQVGSVNTRSRTPASD